MEHAVTATNPRDQYIVGMDGATNILMGMMPQRILETFIHWLVASEVRP